MLTVIPGAKSFEHLRTVNGIVYERYQQACLAMGLLQDDEEWVQCFKEGITFATGKALRILFATAVLYAGVVDPQALWIQFAPHLCDDLPHEIQRLQISIPADLEQPYLDYGLYLLR